MQWQPQGRIGLCDIQIGPPICACIHIFTCLGNNPTQINVFSLYCSSFWLFLGYAAMEKGGSTAIGTHELKWTYGIMGANPIFFRQVLEDAICQTPTFIFQHIVPCSPCVHAPIVVQDFYYFIQVGCTWCSQKAKQTRDPQFQSSSHDQ